MTRITLALQCHNFQRRFAWMLSSLADQTRRDLVTVDVAHMPRNGNPTTEWLVRKFRRQLDIRSHVYPSKDRFQYRGVVRNDQLQECATEWLMFADCDMVYHPEYFEKLSALLEKEHKDAAYMLSSGRISQHGKQESDALVSWSFKDGKVWKVERTWEQADKMGKRRMPNVGAGFCQLINVKHCPHGGYYIKAEQNPDWNWGKGSNPKSDVHFRRRVSAGHPRRNLPRWFTWKAIHLNHDRDPEAGKHLEHQR
jgi:hypothetical protein